MEIQPMTTEEADAPLEESADLSTVSDADLDAALSKIDDGVDSVDILETEPEQTAAPEEEAKPKEAEAVDPPAGEEEPIAAEAETKAAVEEAPEVVEATPETNGESNTELAEIRSMMELSDLKSEKAATEADRWRFLADRNAGELAHIKDQLKARELSQTAEPGGLPREPGYDELPGANDQQRAAVMPPEFQTELSEIRGDRVTRAIETEGARFSTKHRDFLEHIQKQDEAVNAAFTKDFNDLLAKGAKDFETALVGSDAKLAGVTARTVYDSALVDARIKMAERHLETIRSGKQEAKAAIIEQKKAAALTPGQTTPSPEASGDKPLHLMSDKEFNETFRRTKFR